MARVRWTGDGAREVMFEVDGATTQVDFPHDEWQDVPAHVAAALGEQDGWESEAVKKAAKTRATNDESAPAGGKE